MLAADYFPWDEVLPLAGKKAPDDKTQTGPVIHKPIGAKDTKLLHDEITEKFVAIGELPEFDSRAEVRITVGAIIDAVWETKIGNMGKAVYALSLT